MQTSRNKITGLTCWRKIIIVITMLVAAIILTIRIIKTPNLKICQNSELIISQTFRLKISKILSHSLIGSNQRHLYLVCAKLPRNISSCRNQCCGIVFGCSGKVYAGVYGITLISFDFIRRKPRPYSSWIVSVVKIVQEIVLHGDSFLWRQCYLDTVVRGDSLSLRQLHLDTIVHKDSYTLRQL